MLRKYIDLAKVKSGALVVTDLLKKSFPSLRSLDSITGQLRT